MVSVLDKRKTNLKTSVQLFTKEYAGFQRFRNTSEEEIDIDRSRLEAVAAHGWIGLLVPLKRGGLGMGMTELAVVMKAMGEGLVTEPITELAVSAWAISLGNAATGLTQDLFRLLTGQRLVMPLITDVQAAADEVEPILATNEHHGYQLTGSTPFGPFFSSVDSYLINAVTQEDMLICAVNNTALGLRCDERTNKDGTKLRSVILSGVFINEESLVSGRKQGLKMAESIQDRILIGKISEILGVILTATRLCYKYLGSFAQIIRQGDSIQKIENALSIASEVVTTLESQLFTISSAFDRGIEQRTMLAKLKIKAIDTTTEVVRILMKLHDFLDQDDNADIILVSRRAMTLSNQYGSVEEHRNRLVKLSSAAQSKEKVVGGRLKKRPKRKRRRSIFSGMVGK